MLPPGAVLSVLAGGTPTGGVKLPQG
jgi:hypothetical protein